MINSRHRGSLEEGGIWYRYIPLSIWIICSIGGFSRCTYSMHDPANLIVEGSISISLGLVSSLRVDIWL